MDVVRELVSAGVPADKKDKFLRTPLHYALLRFDVPHLFLFYIKYFYLFYFVLFLYICSFSFSILLSDLLIHH